MSAVCRGIWRTKTSRNQKKKETKSLLGSRNRVLKRSGVTVSALLMQKVDRETALRFSFLMSVPAVVGILALEVLTGNTIPTSVGLFDLAVIEVIVFVVGLASMELLLRLARRINFWKLCLILACIAIAFGVPALFNLA